MYRVISNKQERKAILSDTTNRTIKISKNINTNVNIASDLKLDIDIDSNINTDINLEDGINKKIKKNNNSEKCCNGFKFNKELASDYCQYISGIIFLFMTLVVAIFFTTGDLSISKEILLNGLSNLMSIRGGLLIFAWIIDLICILLIIDGICKNKKNKFLVVIGIILVIIIGFALGVILVLNQFIYYFFGIVGICILVLGGELLISKFNNCENGKDELILSAKKNSLYIVIAFVFVGIATNKIGELDNVNKRERAIWSVYETSYRALEGIEKKIGYIDPHNKENVKEDIKVNKDDELIKVIFKLREDIESTANRYIEYIEDDLYKYVSQISNEANRYIDKLTNIDSNGIYLPKEYMNYLIDILNEASEPWYDLYKKEVKNYNKRYGINDEETSVNEYGKKNGFELRQLRSSEGLFIEEVCYDIDFLGDKTEIIYRLIESGKINPIENHLKDIKEILSGKEVIKVNTVYK